MGPGQRSEEGPAIGLRVKSGWAAAVLVRGPSSAPEAVDVAVVELSDPGVPGSRQPYHAAMGLARQAAPALEALIASVHAHTRRSIAALLERHAAAGFRAAGAGIVVGSMVDPSSIANPHIRAHASEGMLFRTAVAQALEGSGLHCATFVERGLFADAARALGRPVQALKKSVAQLPRPAGRWRADEKAAALAAWLQL
jgi:hypothetical protein